MTMKKWNVYGVVRASTFIGTYEAETEEEAKELAEGDAFVSVCHQCASDIQDPEVEKLIVEEIEEE